MSSYATLKLGVDLTRRRGAAFYARQAVETLGGTGNVTLDEANGTISFDMLFPGNLSSLVGELRRLLIPVDARGEIAFPVAPRTEGTLQPDEITERLERGTDVWDVQFPRGRYVFDARVDADRVTASIVPSSSTMHEIYDALLSLDLIIPNDMSALAV